MAVTLVIIIKIIIGLCSRKPDILEPPCRMRLEFIFMIASYR
jgi:hypothetical protein